MNIKKKILIGVALLAATVSYGQTAIVNGNQITFQGVTFSIPSIIGTPITIQGQTLRVTTNASGLFTVSTSGPDGTNSITPPNNLSSLGAFVENAVNNNNPANIDYYSTNGEWDVRLGAAYAQNSGQAAAMLSVERYGIFSPNIGLGAAVLEGNQGGQNGTAAAYAFGDYRHPIGDVAFSFGLGAGYDNYTGRPMGIAKADVEYRINKHLGSWAGAAYDFEGTVSKKPVSIAGQPATDPSGLIFGGGLSYDF